MKKTILILCVLAGSLCANAQVDTAAMRQYLMTHQSKTELIEKCRDRLFEAIINNNRSKAEELMYYAKTEFETNKLKALSLDEMWLLAIWLRKYQLAASEMVLDSITIEQYRTQANRFRYNLFPMLADSLSVNNDFYRQDIENDKSLSESHRDFLLLFVKDFEYAAPSIRTESEKMNNACDEYLSHHPMSDHETFVRTLMRYKFVHTRPTIEWKLFSLGAAFYSGDLGRLLDNDFSLSTHLGVSYCNFVLNGEMGAVCGRINDDIDFGEAVMRTDYRTFNTFWGINMGYRIQLPYNFAVTPTLGAGWITLSPDEKTIEKNQDLKRAKIKGAHAQPVVGVEVNYEVRFGLVANQKGGYQQLIFSPLLRYTFMPVEFDSPTFKTSGAIHTVTIGIIYEFEKLKRVY